MKIAVIGAGGVGGYFGGKLAQAGNDVTFVARGDHGSALSNNGIHVKSINGDFSVTEIQVTDRISKLQAPDLVLLAVKSWQVKEISHQVKGVLHAESMVVPLQNGVMAIEELSEIIDTKHLISGLCRIISQVEAPGVINHFGATPSIVIGELNNHNTDRIQSIQKLFLAADIDLKVSENIQAELWKKFIMICLSGLQTMARTTLGEMRKETRLRKMMEELLTEVYDVSQKVGVDIDPTYVDKTLSFIDTLPEATTFSLARDVWEGKPSEMEYQNGTVVHLGERYNHDTPINRFIYSCLLPGERMVRGSKITF